MRIKVSSKRAPSGRLGVHPKGQHEAEARMIGREVIYRSDGSAVITEWFYSYAAQAYFCRERAAFRATNGKWKINDRITYEAWWPRLQDKKVIGRYAKIKYVEIPKGG